VKLPPNIAAEVLEYLLLEYGESREDPTALKLSDLSYEGEHLVRGKPTHFWSYPTSSGRSWATVELSEDGYEIGTTKRVPGEPPPRKWWQFW